MLTGTEVKSLRQGKAAIREAYVRVENGEAFILGMNIATYEQGNVFNHATDRVPDVEAVAERQRALGRPMKDKVEVSRNGRVRQTAYRACTVLRPLRDAHGAVLAQAVPGSFYEFISRDRYVDADGVERLDLTVGCVGAVPDRPAGRSRRGRVGAGSGVRQGRR